ncbi:hypothetical protein CLOM_g20107 [Closterium sp. NIES-68]|nr:hypothetical protein CLOM_g20107 [Closterium sp. NIES-68]
MSDELTCLSPSRLATIPEEDTLDQMGILDVQGVASEGSDHSEVVCSGDKHPTNSSLTNEHEELDLSPVGGVLTSGSENLHEALQTTSLSTLLDEASEIASGHEITCASPSRLATIREGECPNQTGSACLIDMVLNDVDLSKTLGKDQEVSANVLLASENKGYVDAVVLTRENEGLHEDSIDAARTRETEEVNHQPTSTVLACQVLDAEADSIKDNGQSSLLNRTASSEPRPVLLLPEKADSVEKSDMFFTNDTFCAGRCSSDESANLYGDIAENVTTDDDKVCELSYPLDVQQPPKPVSESMHLTRPMMATSPEIECPVSPYVYHTSPKNVEPTELSVPGYNAHTDHLLTDKDDCLDEISASGIPTHENKYIQKVSPFYF